MKTTKYKTNINCDHCLIQVYPYLDDLAGEDNWVVELQDKNKLLTVIGVKSADFVIRTVNLAGFEAVPISIIDEENLQN